LGCYNNLLSSLDVRGLNNLQSLNTNSNPLLSCISVNDVAYATSNSNYTKDATTIFSTNCGLYTAIPDANFEQALYDLGIDTVNGDHQVLTATVSGVTYLDVSNKNISDLTGIQAFTILQELNCQDNSLSSLDVSANTALTNLNCTNNVISSLNVSANTALQYLSCYDNLLSSLNVSANTALTILRCGGNLLSSLDVSANTALITLDCENNSLSSLDVSANMALQFLSCSNNQLGSLNVSANMALNYLYCSYNSLSSLDVSANMALQYLSCSNNQLGSLDVSTNMSLIDLYCPFNLLSSLNVSANIGLNYLNCSDNLLSSLDVSFNTLLSSLGCGYNQLSNLDVRGLNNLQILSTLSNPLLSCISVNDVAYATINYTKDATTIFSTNCNGGSTAAVLSGTTTICLGNSATMSVAITGGSSPYTVVYSNGVSNATITSYVSGTAIPVSPTTNTTYTLVSVTDAASNLGTGNSGSAVVIVVSPTNDGSVTTSICAGDSYTWPANGQSYTTAQTNLTHVVGCNTATLNLTITPLTTTGSVTTSICAGDSYTWPANGQTYTTAQNGTTFVSGCNTATLNLTITPATTNGSVTQTQCGGSYTWPANGQTYSASTTQTVVTGCNTATLNLTITPLTTTGSVTTSICAGDSYTWPANGQSYTTAQTNLTHIVGCNTATLNLTIVSLVQWYLDADNDGYYTGTPVPSCVSPGVGYTASVIPGGDCNDAVAAINPGATEICYNNIDDNCDGTKSEGCAPVVVNMVPATTITNFSISLSAFPYTYTGATSLGYRFWIKNVVSGQVREVLGSSRFVTIPSDIRSNSTQYQLRASAIINGEEVAYAGNTITVTSPGITTVTLNGCGSGIPLATLGATISSQPASNVVLYTFRARLTSDVSATPMYYFVTSASRFINSNSFVGLSMAYNTSYSISVSYTFNNNDGIGVQTAPYGSECTIITPNIPLIGLASPTCGSTLARLGTTISAAAPATNATNYQFRIRLTSDVSVEPAYKFTGELTSRFTTLSAFLGLVPVSGTSYTISVRYKLVSGTWSNYGPICAITTPGAPASRQIVNEDITNAFMATAYPNPFANNFMIDVTTSTKENINIKVYDMVGRLIEQRNVNTNELETTTIGDSYPSGVYNVTVTQGEETRTVRVVKR
jgi:hypothetical protein